MVLMVLASHGGGGGEEAVCDWLHYYTAGAAHLHTHVQCVPALPRVFVKSLDRNVEMTGVHASAPSSCFTAR